MSASEECSINQFTAGSTPQLCVLKTALLARLEGNPWTQRAPPQLVQLACRPLLQAL